MFGFLKRKLGFATAKVDDQPVVESVLDLNLIGDAPKESKLNEPISLEETIESKPIDPVLEFKKTIAELQEENELKLIQLVQIQEQLETTFLKEQELQAQLETLVQSHKDEQVKCRADIKQKTVEYDTQFDKITKEKDQTSAKLINAEKEIESLKADLAKLKVSAEAQIQAAADNKKSDVQISALNKEVAELKNQIAQAQKEKDQATQQKEAALAEKNTLAAENIQQKKLAQDLSSKLSDQEQQNELLLLQMHQLQEEVEELFLDKQKISQEHDLQLARWERLEKAIPTYIDHGSLELINVEEAVDFSITHWRIHDYYQSGLTYDQLDFTIAFGVGEAGIVLGHELNEKHAPLYPARVATNQRQFELFRFFSNADWKKLSNILTIMESTIRQGWSELTKPSDFDPRFWQGALSDLIARFRKLPPVLRYDRVALKRELHNIDYEHLWLEVIGVQYGDVLIPKLDFRIGASLVRPDGFSRHPKFEFPLIDRKHKPFETWYPESNDEHGPKFELRYDLDKKAMDMAALLKLSQIDRALVLGIITIAPQLIKDLIAQRISIHRPWVSWAQFAQEASELTSLILRAAREAPAQSSISNPEAASVDNAALPTPKEVIQKSLSKTKSVTQKAKSSGTSLSGKKAAPKKAASAKTVTKKTYPKKVAIKPVAKTSKAKGKK